MYDQLQHSVPWLITISGVLPVTTFCIILYWWCLYHTHISGPYLISGIRTTLTFCTIPYQWLCNTNILCHIWPVVQGLVIYSFFSFSPFFKFFLSTIGLCAIGNFLIHIWWMVQVFVPLTTFCTILGQWYLCHYQHFLPFLVGDICATNNILYQSW